MRITGGLFISWRLGLLLCLSFQTGKINAFVVRIHCCLANRHIIESVPEAFQFGHCGSKQVVISQFLFRRNLRIPTILRDFAIPRIPKILKSIPRNPRIEFLGILGIPRNS